MNFLRSLANIFLLLVGIEYFTVGVLVSLIPLVGGLALWAGLFLTYFGVVPAQLVSYFSPFKFTHNNFFGISAVGRPRGAKGPQNEALKKTYPVRGGRQGGVAADGSLFVHEKKKKD